MSGKIPLKKLPAIKIVGAYALVGGLWILFSDFLIGRIFSDIPTIIKISTFKGWVFIGITSWMLYIFIQRAIELLQRSEQALKDSVARIENEKTKCENILDAVGDGIRILDTNSTILYENKSHKNLMGNHIGEYCYKASAGDDTVRDGGPAGMTFFNGDAHIAEQCIHTENGIKYFETTVSPLKDSAGRTVAVIESIRDITSRKKTDSDLLRTKKLEAIGILARGLSHDFNNLLTGVLGYISLVKTSLRPDDPLYILLTRAEDACLRAEDLTHQLHTVAKDSESEKKTVLISSLIKAASEFALKDSQTECTYNIQDELWPVTVNEDQINQAIFNLVVNACDAMDGKGHITISAENAVVGADNGTIRQGNYIKISIEDEGAGIEEELLPKIFDFYYTTKKLDNTRATGFSLASSYFAINNHKGYIFAESTVGRGSTFFIYLPSA
ncbi:MAG TPA: ATP-binding protein [Dissulfurispiraceae bacterium]|nr:ATP-binding protein [Dissulfurispiraceae bacterium]